MEKTFAALVVAMVVSVMAVPLAYVAGQRSAENSLRTSIEEHLDRSTAEQDHQLAELREELAQATLRQERSTHETRRALMSAGIELPEREPPEPEPVQDEAAPDLTIALEAINSMTAGMSYEEIVERLGRDGTLTLSIVDEAGGVTEQFVWDWLKPDGTLGKVDLSFSDGKLQDKSYRG